MTNANQIKALYKAYVTVEAAVANIKREGDRSVRKCEDNVLVSIGNYITRFGAEFLDADDADEFPDTLKLGCWECNYSPTGHCVYHQESDPAHDCCIFCGEPEERK